MSPKKIFKVILEYQLGLHKWLFVIATEMEKALKAFPEAKIISIEEIGAVYCELD